MGSVNIEKNIKNCVNIKVLRSKTEQPFLNNSHSVRDTKEVDKND